MRYLFIHQNFPGQFLHLLRHLAKQQKHDLLFITENTANHMNGVRKIVHGLGRKAATDIHPDASEFEMAMIRATTVADAGRKLKSLGFTPDIIIGHQGWGEMLNLCDVWPGTPLLGYQEYYYNEEGFDVGFDPEFPQPRESFGRVRAKNAINLLALTNPGHGFTPTLFQHSTYPDWARPHITVLHEGVNLAVCKPDPSLRTRVTTLAGYKVKPAEKLVTFVVRDLEPYRGFHVFMRALPRLLAARPDVRVILVGGDAVSYGARLDRGTWRERITDEIAPRTDMTRVHFAGRVPYETYVKILQRSDAHVYLTYPFVASWSLREAMATGCALVVSDTAPVREFVTHRKTGLMVPFLQPDAIADGVLTLLADGALSGRLRRAARAWAEKNLDMDEYISAYETLIARVIAESTNR
jgi:glycosyltransferase involved in cell wall biosynthesis